MNYTPLYLRAIAQDMILDPHLTLNEAISIRLAQSLYSKATTEKISSIIEQPITQSKIQASIKRLSKKDLISKTIRNEWIITEQ